MNRQQALEWLVGNVTKWPVSIFMRHTTIGWDFYWLNVDGGDQIVFSSDYDLCFDDAVTQQDWLAATDNMKEKCDE